MDGNHAIRCHRMVNDCIDHRRVIILCWCIPSISGVRSIRGVTMWKTRAAFILRVGGPWRWYTWIHDEGSKHAAILAKAKSLNAVMWDFGNADHDEASRAYW